MAGNDQLAIAAISYYAKEGLYRHVQTVVLESVKRYGSDPVLLFWKAYGLIMEDQIPEGIRELEGLLDKRDLVVCVPLLLIHAHKRCKLIDRDAIHSLESQVRSQRQNCREKALYYAAMVLWHLGRGEKAREYVDKMLKLSPGSVEGMILRGWIDLTSTRESHAKKAHKIFEEVVNSSEYPKPMLALLGQAQHQVNRHSFSGALKTLNQAILSYQQFLPPLLEKMKVQVALQEWEQAVETAQKCLIMDMNCVEAHKTLVLSQLVCEGRGTEAASKIGELIHLVDRFEPRNHSLYYQLSLPLARLSCRNLMVLQQTGTLLERALSLAPRNAEYVIELAYQTLLHGTVKEALQQYKKAFNLDETSVPALAGIIHCQILEGQLEDAAQQLEFLGEVRASLGKLSDLLYLEALLAHRQHRPQYEVAVKLEEAAQLHFEQVKAIPLSPKFFHVLNPDLVLQMAQLLLLQSPTEPIRQGERVPDILKKCAGLLEPLSATVPGIIDTVYLLARVKYLSGEMEAAQSLLQKCLDHDPAFTEAHLLLAHVHLHQGSVKLCSQVLELGLSHNFEIQNFPVYHLVRGRNEKQQGCYTAAIEAFQTTLKLLSASKSQDPIAQRRGSRSTRAQPLSVSDRATVHLELADTHLLLGQDKEAALVMEGAVKEFAGTGEEMRVQVASVDIILQHGDIEKALHVLSKVTPEQTHYAEARKKMADIYLKQRKDRKLYIACYKELALKRSDAQSALMLGDAYMNIQEPEKAIEVYEGALRRNPRDKLLASKTGQALVKAHNYNKAVSYYEASLKNSSEAQPHLRIELAELYLKLKQFDKADRTVRTGLSESREAGEDLLHLMDVTQYWQVLGRVYQKAGREAAKITTALDSARDNQARVLKRVGVEQPDAVQSQRNIAADIAFELAEVMAQEQNSDEAVRYYKEALLHNDGLQKARLQLARLYLDQEALDVCEHECVTMLRMDQSDDSAAIVMAELNFKRSNFDGATKYLKGMLDKRKDHFEGLSKLIEHSHRVGSVEQAVAYMEVAEQSCNRPAYAAGLGYCKGLLKWYMNEPVAALLCFNQARKDSEWGERALFNMVQICINPDNDVVGAETFRAPDGESSPSSAEKQDADTMAVLTADKLLKEIRPKGHQSELRYRVMETNVLIASSQSKTAMDKAIMVFTDIATTERDHIPSLVGLATCQMLLKQAPKARNTLKRITKLPWTFKDADDLERAHLLLADIYIQGNKNELAVELLRRALQFNQSCYRAWEYLGFIAEKEQMFPEAAERYQKAWHFSYQKNPGIGYRLAFNHLRAHRYVDAMLVCHTILEEYPQYPRIQKEILDKARASVKT